MSALLRLPAMLLLLVSLGITSSAQAASCLLFPLSCLKPQKKYGEKTEGIVLDIRTTRTEHYEVGPGSYGPGWSSLENKQDWYIWFKVGQTLYQGWHQDSNVFAIIGGYKPKREQWIGKSHKLRFLDEKFLGIKGAAVVIERPDGKDWKLALVSIIGPDGVPECKLGEWKLCPPQAKVNRAAIEAEQLARVQQSGGRSAVDVGAAAIEVPEQPVTEPAAGEAVTADPAVVPVEPADGAASEPNAPAEPKDETAPPAAVFG